MKLSDGLTARCRKIQKSSGEHVHGRRTNRSEYTLDVGFLKDYMDNARGIPTSQGVPGKVQKQVAKSRGTF